MDGAVADISGCPDDFVEAAQEALVDINLTDSSELWLMQWPSNLAPDFDGCEVTLKLHDDGASGSFEGSSGKEYNVVSSAALQPNATVFMSSSSGSKIVGKISRRVSIVRFRDPEEDDKQNNSNLKQMYQRPAGTSSVHPSQSTKMRGSQSLSKRPASTHSSRHKSSISSAGETSKPTSKGKRVHESSPTASMARSSGHVRSGGTSYEDSKGYSSAVSSGSIGNSNQKSPKKKKKSE